MMSDARPALWGIDFPGFDSKTAKTFDTCDSHVVPHRSTEQAQWCLTSEFGWDPVLSPWYDRMMGDDRRGSTRAESIRQPGSIETVTQVKISTGGSTHWGPSAILAQAAICERVK